MASQLWDAACCLRRGKLRGAVPGQEVVNPIDRGISEISQHMAQPSLGVNPVELGRTDQRVNSGGALATASWQAGAKVKERSRRPC